LWRQWVIHPSGAGDRQQLTLAISRTAGAASQSGLAKVAFGKNPAKTGGGNFMAIAYLPATYPSMLTKEYRQKPIDTQQGEVNNRDIAPSEPGNAWTGRLRRSCKVVRS
jgi:alpha-D-ribose 1-methylphosphonate 5-triphosphate synthase subunit PhnI